MTFSVHLKVKLLIPNKLYMPFLQVILRLLVWFPNTGTNNRSTGRAWFHSHQIYRPRARVGYTQFIQKITKNSTKFEIAHSKKVKRTIIMLAWASFSDSIESQLIVSQAENYVIFVCNCEKILHICKQGLEIQKHYYTDEHCIIWVCKQDGWANHTNFSQIQRVDTSTC